MDYNEFLSATAKARSPFPCSCGGTLKVHDHKLKIENGNHVDVITYKCSDCGRKTTQSYDIPYLDELKDDLLKTAEKTNELKSDIKKSSDLSHLNKLKANCFKILERSKELESDVVKAVSTLKKPFEKE